MSEGGTLYGWITKNNPTVKFIGTDKRKVFLQEEHLNERILFFECTLNCSSIGFVGATPTNNHFEQIKGFVNLMIHSPGPLPACEANVRDVRIVN